MDIYIYCNVTRCWCICYQAVREQLVQLMFETFNISGFYASEQAVLSLYAVGRISGCTVDIGHGKIGTELQDPSPHRFSLVFFTKR